MSAVLEPSVAPDPLQPLPPLATAQPMSPNRRAWARFRRNRIGYLGAETEPGEVF